MKPGVTFSQNGTDIIEVLYFTITEYSSPFQTYAFLTGSGNCPVTRISRKKMKLTTRKHVLLSNCDEENQGLQLNRC